MKGKSLQPSSSLPVPAINGINGPSRENVAQALSDLDAYLRTWDTPEGLAGIIATWWSSTVDTAEPHPMNQAPVIQGCARLHEARVVGA